MCIIIFKNSLIICRVWKGQVVMRKVTFRIRNFDKEKFLTFDIDNEANLDEDVLDFLEDEEPNRIVPIIFEEGEEKDSFSYDITKKIRLCDLSNQDINAEIALSVIHGIILALMDIREYRIPLSYLVMNRDYIYIDSDYQVEFICIPLEDMDETADACAILRNFLASLRYNCSENVDYVAKLLTYINQTDGFNLDQFILVLEEMMQERGIELSEDDLSSISVEYKEFNEDGSVEGNNTVPDIAEEQDETKKNDYNEPLDAIIDGEIDTFSSEETMDAIIVDDEEKDDVQDVIIEDEEEESIEFPDINGTVVVEDGSNLFDMAEDTLEEKTVGEASDENEEKAVDNLMDDLLEEEISSEPEEKESMTELEENEEANSVVEKQEESEDVQSISDDIIEMQDKENEKAKDIDVDSKNDGIRVKTEEGKSARIQLRDDLNLFLEGSEKKPETLKKGTTELKLNKKIKINRASIVSNQEEIKAAEELEQKLKEAEEIEKKLEEAEKFEAEAKIEDAEVGETKRTELKEIGSAILNKGIGITSILGSGNVLKANPYLIRVNTEEKIIINKQNFRIGKASMGVDYTVKGNGAVSRIHATIINKDDVYYIKDNKSTNRTFVNEKAVQEGESELLTHDCRIILGDEEFEFKLR